MIKLSSYFEKESKFLKGIYGKFGRKKSITVFLLIAMLFASYFMVIPASSVSNSSASGNFVNYAKSTPTLQTYQPYVAINASYSLSINAQTTFSKATVYFGDGSSSVIYGSGSNTIIAVSHKYTHPGSYYIWYTVTYSKGNFTSINNLIPVKVIDTGISSTSSLGLLISMNDRYLLQPGKNLSLFVGYISQPLNGSFTIYNQQLTVKKAGTSGSYSSFSTKNFPYTFNSGKYSLPYGSSFYNLTKLASGFYQMSLATSSAIVNQTTGVVSSSTHITTTIYDVVVNQSPGTIDMLNNQTITNAELPMGSIPLDPQISYTAIGGELLMNTMETLYGYQGSNSSALFPELASAFPTMGHGINSKSVTRNILVYQGGAYVKKKVTYAPGQVYNFTLRNNATWQDGTSVNAWDAAFSVIRNLIFISIPGTPSWILAQRLLPGSYYQTNTYQNITNNVTWDNATANLTLYFQTPLSPTYVFTLLASAGTYISDAEWFYQHGEGIQFSPSGFQNYSKLNLVINPQSYGNTHIMSDGPYVLQYYSENNRVILAPNPYYKPPATFNGTQWSPAPQIKYVDLTYFSNSIIQAIDLTSGNAQLGYISNMPFDLQPKLISNKNLNSDSFGSFSLFWYNFNMNVNLTNLYQYDANANLPPSLFANLYVRLAFAYAFNDKQVIRQAVNNLSGTVSSGTQYAGIIPSGMPGYQNLTVLNKTGVTSGVPYYNMIMAKAYWNDFLNSSVNLNVYKISSNGNYNGAPLNIPIFPFGNTSFSPPARWWSQNLTKMVFGNTVPAGGGFPVYYWSFIQVLDIFISGQAALPIYGLGWGPDYMYPDDYLGPMANPYNNETYPATNSFTIQWFNNSNNPARNNTEVNIMKNMSAEFHSGQTSTNKTRQLMYFDQMNHNLVNLSVYVPLYQQKVIYSVSKTINNSRFIVYENSPMIAGGSMLVYNDISIKKYSVTVSESGLPTGNQWFVNLTDASSVSTLTGATINMMLPNGTYNYTIGTMNGSYFVPPGGSFTVNGHSVSFNVKFTGKIPYAVTFTETGLSSTGKWYVNLTGMPSSGAISNTSYTANLINGSYSYKISTTDKRYEPAPRSGSLTVNGGTGSVSVSFSELLFGVALTESGLPTGTNWQATVNGNTLASTTTTISFSEPNGTYNYKVGGAAGYSAMPPLSFKVSGASKAVPVTFLKNATVYVDVKTAGAAFSVNGKPVALVSGKATLNLAPGNYFFNATEMGYYTYSNLTYVGSSVYHINISLVQLLAYGTLIGKVVPGYAFVSASGVVIPVTNGTFDQSLSPGQYLISAEASGYVSHDYLVNITQSKTTYLNITLAKASLSYIISGQVSPKNSSVMFGTYVAYVNTTGYYDISLPKGTYSYSITNTGYFPSTGNISVTSNLVVNFKLIAEPPPQSVKKASNITASGYNVTITNLTTGNGNISITYNSAANGTLVVMLPYSQVKNATISNIMSSKVYINGTQYGNFTVALSSINGTFSVILTVYGLKGDPVMEWAYSPSVHVAPPPPTNTPPPSPSPTPPFSYGTLQIIIIALAVAATVAVVFVGLRRSKYK